MAKTLSKVDVWIQIQSTGNTQLKRKKKIHDNNISFEVFYFLEKTMRLEI